MGVFLWQRRVDGRDSVIQVKWVSERHQRFCTTINELMVVQVMVGGSVLNVLSVYTPQVDRTLDEKMDFYAALETRSWTEVGSDERLMGVWRL